MPRDARVDAYIARSAPFARPLLRHLRALVHAACPGAAETIKWGMPAFVYAGQPLCGMAAFKAHCTFGLWKASLIPGLKDLTAEQAMGQFGRVTRLKDLPGKRVLTGYLKAAARLNEDGVKVPRTRPGTKPPARTPADLTAALARNAKARKVYAAFPPGQRREYVEWLAEAKRPETRAARLAQAVAWMAEGKPRNWKYMKKA